jgi:hypothetical protein
VCRAADFRQGSRATAFDGAGKVGVLDETHTAPAKMLAMRSMAHLALA